jgi:colanic acid biosynthesis glycosyl transferase WcaI
MTSGLVPGLLARRLAVPLLIHVQDLQLDAARELGILRQPLLLAGLTWLELHLFRQARAVTTISRSMAARLAAKGVPPARLQVLPNWADLDKVRPGPRLNALRRELGLTSETVVLYAGNLGEKQGLEVILEAAALTRGKPSIRYLVAGEGAARDRIKLRAQDLGLDNLTFLPLQSNSRLPLLLAAADLHLVVQRQKAADLVMPSKLTNIMAAGRPFIATAGEGTELARVTTESRAGLVVPPEDGRALAQAVLGLAGDPGARKKMGVLARRYAEAFWDRERILRQWEELLRGLD